MDNFASHLRAKLASKSDTGIAASLASAARWLDRDVAPNLERKLEEAVEAGKDRTLFRHTYVAGRPEVLDIEKLPEYQFLKARCEHLGLHIVPMSHKRMADSKPPEEYPCLELLILVPPERRDAESTSLANSL